MQLDPSVQKLISRKKPLTSGEFDSGVPRNQFMTAPSRVAIEERIISNRPSGYVTMRIFRPADNDTLLAPLIYLPGLDWSTRIPQLHDPLLIELSLRAQLAVLLIDFSLSPQAKFPTALEECFCVLKWVAENGRQHDLDSSRILVAGDGCGGNLATTLSILTKKRSGPPISRQILFNPATDAHCNTLSHQNFATGYCFDHADMVRSWTDYLEQPDQRDEILVSPLQASVEQLQGLPDALIITAEADILRDEGESYASRLHAAGVKVTQTRFQGTIHGFMILNSLAHTTTARDAISLTVQWLREPCPHPSDRLD